jgi:DNA polymerase-4
MFNLLCKQKRNNICHIDADAFFASVEQVLNPNLKNKPVIVGGANDSTGIVSACSYEAKRMGIKTAMPIYLAKINCPSAFFVSGNFEAYRDFSNRMYNIFSKYTPDVEMASIEEAYLDITGMESVYKKTPVEIAKSIMLDIYRNLGISVSCGLSSNKTVSKIASSINKPHKLTVIPFGKERAFLRDLPLSVIPGIGTKTFSLLERKGFRTIMDIAKLSVNGVVDALGVQGIPIWKKCRGIDNSPVVADFILPKSISKEKTFYPHVFNINNCLKDIKTLSELVLKKLRDHDMKAKTIFLKIRYRNDSGFEDFSFQKHLGFSCSSDSEIFPALKSLFLQNASLDAPIRLIGVGVSNLLREYNLNLFGEFRRADRLCLAVDKINNLYGEGSLSYGR